MSRPDRADARAASAGAASARIADARAAAPGSERTSSAIMSLIGERPVMLAPMSGVTEAPFRGICRRMGASLTYTEMVSAKGLHYNPDSRAARALLRFSAEEVPVALQLFGADPQIMAEQAARLSADRPGEIALIDINMGCPVAKVVAKGEGSALMRDPKTAVAVVEAVRAACPLPVTAKIRSGWSASEKNAVEFSLALEQAGVAAVAVHGRTRDQFYRGRADKEVIARVKSAVGIPVFGSGDVLCAQDVVEMFDQTGADGVMVARGAYGNPWIFREARHLLDTGETLAPPSAAERLAVAREHAAALVDAFGERAVARMRKHLAWYLSGLPAASHARTRINGCTSYAELVSLLDEYEHYLAE